MLRPYRGTMPAVAPSAWVDQSAQVIGDVPTPEFAAMMAEECQRLLERLADPALEALALAKMEGCTNEEIANTAADLLRHLPLRYEKEYAEGAISDLPMDGIGTARGTVVGSRWVGAAVGTRGRFQATLQDHSARLDLTWFNAPWLRDKLHPGMVIRVQGKVKAYRAKVKVSFKYEGGE